MNRIRERGNIVGDAGEERTLRIAYITDVFPPISLTFLYLEIKKLRHMGTHVDLYAIWKSRKQTTTAEGESFSNGTRYLWPPPIRQLLRVHFHYARKVPARYLETLKLCLVEHPKARLRLRTLCNFLLAPYLAGSLEKKPVAHIHAHFASGAATVAMMASRLLNIGFSFTAHGSDILIERVLLNEKLKMANFAIAISDYNRKSLVSQAPEAEPSKVRTIHCGVNPDVFLPCTRTNQHPPVFLAVGNLVWQKGHAYLIEACRFLKARGVEYRCVIIGEGPKREELENLIRRYNMEEEVDLHGSVPHESIQLYYNRADILVHPSISEGIPVVLMEAMSKELTVIATRITGVPELVEHGEDGLLVAPGNVAELAEAMVILRNNKELRTRLGNNARRKILRAFNAEVNIKKIKKLFESELRMIHARDSDAKH